MRNIRLWLAACLALLFWCGFGWAQEPDLDEANAKQGRALLEQGVKLYRARDFSRMPRCAFPGGGLGWGMPMPSTANRLALRIPAKAVSRTI